MQSTVTEHLPPIVSAMWLSARISRATIVIVDASWYLPTSNRDADAEYRTAHIPGAIRLDWDAISDDATDLPHMVPPPGRFAAAMESLGIAPGQAVIVYDGSGLNISAARAWWTFRVFGHENVAVLDGGFHAWAAETRPVQSGVNRRAVVGYPVPAVNAALVRDMKQVEGVVRGDYDAQLLDCRPSDRFRGDADEPRPGLRRGHIDGSRNIAYSEFTDPQTKRLLPPARIRALFETRGIDVSRQIVASCGSGMSACVAALAVEVLREAGEGPVGPPVAIYDGSWAEWGRAT